jgi:hypothetical protein
MRASIDRRYIIFRLVCLYIMCILKIQYKVYSRIRVYVYLYLSYFSKGFQRVGDIGGTDYTRSILPTTYITSALFDRKQGSHFDISTSNLYHVLCREAFQFLAPTLFQKLTFRFSTTSATSKIDDGGFGRSAAALSGCLPSQGKSSPLRSGWLSFLLRIVLCLLRFASFCFAIVVVCAPNPFLLSLFTLFLVTCWLPLIPWLHILSGFIPWLHSSVMLLLGYIPLQRRCSCSVPSLALAVLGSSASPWCSSSAPHLIAFDSVLHTKPSASPRCSPSVPRCSARNLRP